MSFGSIFTSMSGLNAGNERLSVIGNNVANMNTVGFKERRAEFANLVRNSIVGDRGLSAGIGVEVASMRVNFAQGALAQSNNAMDWAIDGNGFFVVNDSADNSFYTRDGQFNLRSGTNSYSITDAGGNILQGYLVDAEGVIGSALEDITMNATMAGKATANASMILNLDSSSVLRTAEFDAADPSTYNFSASETIYVESTDGADASHTLTTFFAKTDDNVWEIYAQADDGPTASVGQLEFDTDGTMISGATQTLSVTVPIDGDPPSTVSQTIALDLTGTTQFGSSSGVMVQTQDGHDGGQLESVTLGEHGILTGNFSNQQHQAVGQVALASFEAPWGLGQTGRGLFVASEASGAATAVKPGSVWEAGNPSVGEIRAGTLELSNVELTDNFVDMIATEFSFQACSKAITLTDEILQTAINLKR